MSRLTGTLRVLQQSIGHEFEPGRWLDVTQARIDAFAACTEDFQFIHVDGERAAQTEFGGTIAHGFLTLSLLSALCMESTAVPSGAQIGLNYGFDKVRFLNPVRSGKRVRARVKLLDVKEKGPGRALVSHAVTVEIEGEPKPALSAEWLLLWML